MTDKKTAKIFKPNVTFEVKKIDFSCPDVKTKIEKINKTQEEILSRRAINVDKLNAVVLL